jgi:hypothetical protein
MYQGQPGTSAVAVVSATDQSRPTIEKAIVCNPTGGAVTFSVWVVKDGDTAADDIIVYHDVSVAAGATTVLDALEKLTLPRVGDLQIAASAGSSLTFTISGYTTRD